MKNKIIKNLSAATLILLQLNDAQLYAQPYNGKTTYNHNTRNCYLTDGNITSINSAGFIMAGIIVNPTLTIENLYIDKTAVDGTFTTGVTFQQCYLFSSGGTSCGTVAQETVCYGASIKEIQQGPSLEHYVIAASYSSGCLYASLDASGVPVSSMFYVFPTGTSSATKPKIVPSIAYPGSQYITGSLVNSGITYMYFLFVNQQGNLINSAIYDLGNGTRLIPYDMVVSPYFSSSEEVAIVGVANYNGDDDGFFLRLDGATGAVTVFQTYDSGSNDQERFFCMDIANNTNNSSFPGFVIGGYTSMAGQNTLFMKIDQNGTIDWSTRLTVNGPNVGNIVGIKERFSTTYGLYEYYLVSNIPSQGTYVFKMNDIGGIFTQIGNTNSQFVYQISTGQISTPVAITFTDGSSFNDGIQVFGTDANTGGQFYMVQSAFNGVSASCSQSLNLISGVIGGPTTVNSPPIFNSISPLAICYNFSFSSNATNTYVPSQPCYSYVLPGAGNNSRLGAETSIVKNDPESVDQVFFDMAKCSLLIHRGYNSINKMNVSLFDLQGKLIVQESFSDEKSLHVLPLVQFNLANGLYLLNMQSPEGVVRKKINIQR